MNGWSVQRAPLAQGTSSLHLVPPNERFEVWVFAEEPDFVNVEIDTIPVAGRVDGFTLHLNQVKGAWQLLAAADDVWVTAHILPLYYRPRTPRVLTWLDAFADYANENPAPACD